MRLIDADNIRGCAKYIKTNEKFEPYIMIDDLSKLLDKQPTAYSVDGVVEDIMEAYGCHNCEQVDTMACNECAELEVLNEICEIVKQGGVRKESD